MKEIERIQVEERIFRYYEIPSKLTPANLQELFLRVYDDHPVLIEDSLYLEGRYNFDEYNQDLVGYRWETDAEFERRKNRLIKLQEKNLAQQLKQEEKARQLYEQLKKKYGGS